MPTMICKDAGICLRAKEGCTMAKPHEERAGCKVQCEGVSPLAYSRKGKPIHRLGPCVPYVPSRKESMRKD